MLDVRHTTPPQRNVLWQKAILKLTQRSLCPYNEIDPSLLWHFTMSIWLIFNWDIYTIQNILKSKQKKTELLSCLTKAPVSTLDTLLARRSLRCSTPDTFPFLCTILEPQAFVNTGRPFRMETSFTPLDFSYIKCIRRATRRLAETVKR